MDFLKASNTAEDTNLGLRPLYRKDSPLDAVKQFLAEDRRFISSDIWERNLFSFHAHGWLKRQE